MCMACRVRIDRLLVERGLFTSRAKAQTAIAAGRVTADDVVVAKPSEEISADAVLRAEPAHPYVSRGGVKLAAALDHFRSDPKFDPRGRVCLDVGASTGGFTEVLLARGARRVYAVDVGRGQLHPSLRARTEIVSMEATDIRALDPTRLTERPAGGVRTRADAGASLGADQAAIRSRPTSLQKKHRARSPRSYRGLRGHRRLRRVARLARRRRRALVHPGQRRQPRVLHRSRAQLNPARCAFLLP